MRKKQQANNALAFLSFFIVIKNVFASQIVNNSKKHAVTRCANLTELKPHEKISKENILSNVVS